MSKLVIYRQEIQRTPPPAKGMLARVADLLFRSSTQAPLTLRDPELARRLGLNGGDTSAGIVVTEANALTYSAVWAAVTLISSQIASLPLILYKRLPNGGKERFASHQTYRLLHDEFNPEMGSMVARETMMGHVLTWGNAYAEIERDVVGRPIALWPLLPSQVTPYRDEAKRLWYHVATPDVPAADIPAADMLHIPGLGFDGLVGYSPIRMAKESLALGLAAQKFGATFFGNGATFGGALEHPGPLGEEGADNLRKSIDAVHQGPARAHRFLILEEGMKYTKYGVDPNAAQFLETRQFEISEVARWFNIPPHKLRDLMRATFSNIEQQSIEFVTDTLRPWLIRWEQEINRKLISRSERNIQHAEHLVEGLLRGDIASRYSAYAVGRQWGWLSADDIRERENMNPLPDGQGKMYLVPLNMAPADRIGEVVDSQTRKPEPAVPAAPVVSESDGEEDDARHEAVLSQIREGQRHVALLTDALALQTQQIAGLDARLSDAAVAQADRAEELATAQGEMRARLEAEQAAHAEAVTALTSARAELLARTDAWREEKSQFESQIADKQAELSASQSAADAGEWSTIEALKTEHAAELQRVRDDAAQELVAAQERSAQEAKAQADAAVLEATTRERTEATAVVSAAEAQHAAHIDALNQESEAERRRIEEIVSVQLAEAEARAIALTTDLEAVRQERDSLVGRLATSESVGVELGVRISVAEAQSADRAVQVDTLETRVGALLSELEQARANRVQTEADRAAAEAIHQQALAEAHARSTQQLADVESAIRLAHDAALREQLDTSRREASDAQAQLVSAHEASLVEVALRHQSELDLLREQLARDSEEATARVTDLREALASASSALEQAQATLLAQAALVERADREREAAHAARQAAEARAEQEATARIQAEAAASRKQDHASVLSAHRALVADTMRRMIERETDRARRAQATPQKLRAWVDTFYSAHEDLCRTALLPVVRVHLAWMRSEQDASSFAGDLARSHVEDSLRDLRSVLDEDQEEFSLALSTMLHRWETDRPSVIADRLLQKELDHASRLAGSH